MTIPVAAAMLIATVVSTAVSFQQQSAARADQKALRAEQTLRANEAAVANYDQITLRRTQEQEAASQKVFENRLESLQTTATAQVAADEAGVSGPSVDAFLRQLYGREARFNESVSINLENTQDQLDQQAIAVQNRHTSDLTNRVQVQPIDYAGLAGQAVSGVVSAYGADLQIGAAGGSTLF